jgi:membrane-associated phospholipid phosphatase
LNEVIFLVMASVTMSVLILAFVSIFWKISAHATGISGMIGLLAVINNKTPDSSLFYPILILIFLGGCLTSARLYLNAHSPLQIVAGIGLGLAIGILGEPFIFLVKLILPFIKIFNLF